MPSSAGRASAAILVFASLFLPRPQLAAQPDPESDISSDEQVVFFPGVAVETGPGSFDAHIRGWIFEPLKESRTANKSVAAFVRLLVGLDSGVLPLDQLRNRGKLLFVDTERNQKIPIDIAGRRVTLAASEPGGHFEDRVALQGVQRASGEWIEYRAAPSLATIAHFRARAARRAHGPVGRLRHRRHDQGLERQQQVRAGVNTFVRDFRGVAGMSDLYNGWARRSAVVFHYVSGSPWQLLAPIADFMEGTASRAGRSTSAGSA